MPFYLWSDSFGRDMIVKYPMFFYGIFNDTYKFVVYHSFFCFLSIIKFFTHHFKTILLFFTSKSHIVSGCSFWLAYSNLILSEGSIFAVGEDSVNNNVMDTLLGWGIVGLVCSSAPIIPNGETSVPLLFIITRLGVFCARLALYNLNLYCTWHLYHCCTTACIK